MPAANRWTVAAIVLAPALVVLSDVGAPAANLVTSGAALAYPLVPVCAATAYAVAVVALALRRRQLPVADAGPDGDTEATHTR